MRTNSKNPAIKTATCAALIAASLAIGNAGETASISSIERYCHTSWRQAGVPEHEWDDCTQETLLELLSRVPRRQLTNAIEDTQSAERRELMRSVWCVAQRWRRSTQRQAVSLDTLGEFDAGGVDLIEQLTRSESLQLALATLSDTQQHILRLWSAGNSIADISRRLRIPAARVSDQKYKAVRLLRQLLPESLVG